MLNYGLYCQKYFGYNTDNPAYESGTLTANEIPETFDVFSVKGTLPAGISYVGSSLLLKSNTKIRHYFSADRDADVTGLNKAQNGYYYYESEPISVTDLADINTYKLGSWTITYSPITYARRICAKNGYDQDLKNVCLSLYEYYLATKSLNS